MGKKGDKTTTTTTTTKVKPKSARSWLKPARAQKSKLIKIVLKDQLQIGLIRFYDNHSIHSA